MAPFQESNLGFKLIIALMAIALGIFLARTMTEETPYWTIILAVGILCAAITFISPSTGLYLIIIAMMFSPEIPFMPVLGSRRAVLRFDDLIIVFVSLSWLVAKVLRHEAKHLHRTPLDFPIAAFIFSCSLSTARGVLINQVYPLKGFFYVLKLVEYILIYYMVVNNTHTKKQIYNYLRIFFVVALAVSIYGYAQIGAAGRVTAPFETEAEPNTYGGYFIFVFALIFGFVIAPVRGFNRTYHLFLLLFIIPPYLYTLSRGSYLAFFPVLIALIWFSPPGRKKVPIVFLLVTLLSIPFLPREILRRVESTFRGRTSYEVPWFGPEQQRVSLDKSSVARLQTWDMVMKYWLEYPVLGLGITGAGFIDSQWMRTVGELGLIGIVTVIWLFRSIIANGLRLFRDHYNRENDVGFTLALGYLAGLIGLMTHAVTANTFYIVRIMGPFWFITATIVMLQKFEQEEKEEAQARAAAAPAAAPVGYVHG